jgi:hypothetical protein
MAAKPFLSAPKITGETNPPSVAIETDMSADEYLENFELVTKFQRISWDNKAVKNGNSTIMHETLLYEKNYYSLPNKSTHPR